MYLETYGQAHILGGLIGQALGDAWTMPAYFRPDQTWNTYNGWIAELMPAPPDHPVFAGYSAGQITANTQQALILAQTIIAEGAITLAGTAQSIITWYDEIDGDNSPSVGLSTRQAVAALKTGQDPQVTGLYGDTVGGAARTIPIGLIHPGQPETAVQDAITTCMPTHFTDVAVSGACAVAAAVAQALTPDTTLEEIIDAAMWGADTGLQYGSVWVGASVARKTDYAVQLASDVNLSEQDRIQNLYDLIGSTRAVADSVPCAFGILAMANGNPLDTAMYAAALSGDGNTVGAIACAVAGAWHGIEAIPNEYVDILHQANPQYNFEAIAVGLHDVALLYEDSSSTSPADDNLLENILKGD
jgi:ADP-ribosylglycohydrolase